MVESDGNGHRQSMVENSAEYGMPLIEDATDLVFGTGKKMDSAHKESRN